MFRLESVIQLGGNHLGRSPLEVRSLPAFGAVVVVPAKRTAIGTDPKVVKTTTFFLRDVVYILARIFRCLLLGIACSINAAITVGGVALTFVFALTLALAFSLLVG